MRRWWLYLASWVWLVWWLRKRRRWHNPELWQTNGTLRTVWAVSYPTRHAAFLALAAALLEESRS